MTIRSMGPLAGLVALIGALAPSPGRAQSIVKAGPEFRLNEFTLGAQRVPAAIQSPDGYYVIVWESQTQDGDAGGIFGRRMHPNGTLGPEFQVNESIVGDQKQPAVGVDPAGRFTVVWAGPDGFANGIVARQFTGAGPAGPEFGVNTTLVGEQAQPRVSAGPGGVAVVWQGSAQDGTGENVYGRILGPTGTPITAEFVLSNTIARSQTTPVVAALSNGNYAVAWLDFPLSSQPRVLSRLFDGAGTPLRSETAVSSGFLRADTVTIAAGPAGTFEVGWWESTTIAGKGGASSTDYGVKVRRHAANGIPTTEASTGGMGYGSVARYQPSIAVNFTGRLLATYTSEPFVLMCFLIPPHLPSGCSNVPEDGSGGGVFARALGSPSSPSPIQVNTFNAGNQSRSAAAGDPFGNSLVVWQSDGQDGSGTGIYGQRLGGMAPIAVIVDPTGNGVLEPGSPQEIRPSWLNINGAAQAFGGSVWGFSAPAGTVIDGTADYGNVPAGAVQSCTSDCYSVMVTEPPVRLATHWDTFIGESLAPEQFGVHTIWTLHVGASFTDVSTASPFYRFIETLLHNGITGGCGGTSYCPRPAINREQLAVFVLVAKERAGYAPPACTTPMFADVPAASPYCRWIEELARRGVVGGCGGGSYCPTADVTREQMAIFALRTLNPAIAPPACTTPVFADVPADSPFCPWVEELVRRGVVAGCGGGNYCPAYGVSREQMAVFLSVTFGLRLY